MYQIFYMDMKGLSYSSRLGDNHYNCLAGCLGYFRFGKSILKIVAKVISYVRCKQFSHETLTIIDGVFEYMAHISDL